MSASHFWFYSSLRPENSLLASNQILVNNCVKRCKKNRIFALSRWSDDARADCMNLYSCTSFFLCESLHLWEESPYLGTVNSPSGYVTKVTQRRETEGLGSMKHSPWTRLLLANIRITHLHISEALWLTMCPKWKMKRRKHNLVFSMPFCRWVSNIFG